MKMISEDSPTVASSILLKKYFDIAFTSSNTQLVKAIDEYDDSLLVYVDTPPINRKALEIYKSLKSYSELPRVKRKHSVFIVPIPCMEYMILRSFRLCDVIVHYDNYPFLNDVYKMWCLHKGVRDVPPKTHGYKGSFANYERISKALLSNMGKQYMNSELKNSDKELGRYYTEGCNEITLEKKGLSIGIQFLLSVPLDTTNNIFNLDVKQIEQVDDIVSKYTNRYFEWYNNYTEISLE